MADENHGSVSVSALNLKHSPRTLRPFRLLAGQEEPRYPLEPALRLWQVKYWLTSARPLDRALRLGGLILATIVVRQGMAVRSGLPWPRLKTVMRDDNIRHLFNSGFSGGRLFTPQKVRISLDRVLASRRGPRRRKHMEYWIEQARVRVNLKRQFDYAPIQNVELLMMEMKRLDPEYNDRVFGSGTGEKSTQFKKNALFLRAAQDVCPSLLNFDYKVENLIEQLSSEIPPADQFKAFCARSRSMHKLLEMTEADFLDRAFDLLPESLPNYDPVPEELELMFERPMRHITD